MDMLPKRPKKTKNYPEGRQFRPTPTPPGPGPSPEPEPSPERSGGAPSESAMKNRGDLEW